MAPVRTPPELPWASLRARLARDWRPGEHVTIVGPTRSGKTHIAVELAELCSYVLVLATKRQDPLIVDLRSHGYLVTGDLQEVLWTHDQGQRPVPVHPRVVYWPQFGQKMEPRARIAAQAAAMRRAIDWADKTGGWAVLVDETMWMTRQLRLERELEQMWFQGRTQGVSVIACAQRPAHVPRLAFSSADYLFLAYTGDKRDVENLREISAGIPVEVIDESVRALDFDRHEFLFVDTHARELARVVAPSR